MTGGGLCEAFWLLLWAQTSLFCGHRAIYFVIRAVKFFLNVFSVIDILNVILLTGFLMMTE